MSERNKGILFIILAAFFFSLMTVFIRLSGDLPTMEKALFRNLVATIVSWFIILKSGESLKAVKTNFKDLFVRAACGTTGLICNFYAVDHLNISDANMLNKLSPFFAIFTCWFLLKEKPHKLEWFAIILAFCGALFVIKPDFSLNTLPALIGLLGGIGAGVAYGFVRRLGKNKVKGPIIVMFFSTFSTLVTLPFFIMQYKPMTYLQLIFLFLAGLSACGGQLTITAAYTHAPAKEISVYDYSQVIFAAVWGFILFDQIPDILSFIGYGIIFAAAIIKYMDGKNKPELFTVTFPNQK